MKEYFKLGNFKFSLSMPDELELPENMKKFRVCQGVPEKTDPFFQKRQKAETAAIQPGDGEIYSYEIFITEQLPDPEGRVAVQRRDLTVLKTKDQREERLIGVKGEERPYALYRETSPSSAEIFLGNWYVPWISAYDVMFASLLCLERRLSDGPYLILHCAYIETQGSAVLFSAPSGTGKSTQAGLWETWRKARTINGDKALLIRKPGGDSKGAGTWQAAGWPICGTSGICHNEKHPIRAVVMLEQAKENRAERLGTAEAFRALYGQITVNRWDREELLHGMELLEWLVSEVPVFHLACDISRDAVEVLAAELEKME